jgi:hypothetical protein
MKGKKKGKKFFVYAGHDKEEQIFLSLYPNFFDYSLGGYSHREQDETINFEIKDANY